MIKFQNVTKKYDEHKALDAVNLDIRQGEFISLVGLSGAGKTTLFKVLLGEEKVEDGRVLVDEVDIGKLKKSELPYLRRKIGTVFQDIKLLPESYCL